MAGSTARYGLAHSNDSCDCPALDAAVAAAPTLAEPWRTLLGPAWTPPVVLDWLPGALSYLDAAGFGWSCDALGQAVLCTVPPGGDEPFEMELTLSTDVAPDTPDRVFNMAGLSTAPLAASEPAAALAAQCAPVEDSSASLAVAPPRCIQLADTP